MSDINKFLPILIKLEGGYVRNPKDKGGSTKYGITISTARINNLDKDHNGIIDDSDIQLLTEDDYKNIVLKDYWNPCKADQILNQSIANFIVDFAYNSGVRTASKVVQRILNLNDDGTASQSIEDGIIGSDTLSHINSFNQRQLFELIFEEREKFYNSIVTNNPDQKIFLKGWLNRIKSYMFE